MKEHVKRNTIQSELLEAVEQVSITQRIKVLLSYWPLFIITMIICLALAFLYLKTATPQFSAIGSVMIKDDKKAPEVMNNSMLNEIGLRMNNKLVENEIEVLKSYDLMESVVNNLALFTSISKVDVFRNESVDPGVAPFSVKVEDPNEVAKLIDLKATYSLDGLTIEHGKDKYEIKTGNKLPVVINGVEIRLKQDSNKVKSIAPAVKDAEVYAIKINTVPNTVKKYRERLSVDAANKLATVISLEFRDEDEKRAVDVLGTLLTTYNQNGLEDKNKMYGNTVAFLDNRLQAVSAILKNVESNVEQFKSRNKVTNLATDAEQYLEAAEQADSRKAVSQTQLNIINALQKDLIDNADNSKLVPSTLGLEEPTLETLIQKHNSLVLQNERVLLKSGPKNPMYLDSENQIKEIRTSILENVKNLKQSYSIALNDITRKDEELSSRIKNVPLIEKQLLQITRNKNVQEQLYSFLLQKREEAAMAKASNVEDTRIITRARSQSQVSPKPLVILGVAFLLGLILPIIYSTIRESFYNKVGTVEEIDKAGLELLGVISNSKKADSLILSPRNKSLIAEQIRNIRTGISHIHADQSTLTLTTCSFQPGEGKSFVASNLAASYALLKKKTIILEFDLRKPSITSTLNLKSKTSISDLFESKVSLSDHIISVPNFNDWLHVLPAGIITSNPTEMIASNQMKKLMTQLKSEYDVIIIDTPPLSLVSDATLLQEFADLTILVMRQGYTLQRVYREIKLRLRNYPEFPMLFVLNGYGKGIRYDDAYFNMGKAKGYYDLSS